MTNEERDEEYDVIWAGGEGLVADRVTKILGYWTPPHRLYNKTGKHSKKNTLKVEPHIIEVINE